jgi:hypothetical protein
MKVYFEKVHIAQASFYLFIYLFISCLVRLAQQEERLLDHLHHKTVEKWNSV